MTRAAAAGPARAPASWPDVADLHLVAPTPSRAEAARLEAIRRYDILDTPPDAVFDRITALAARLFDVPVAIVSVVDVDRIWFKSHHGIDFNEIPRDDGLCASAILQDGPWVITDAPRDPRALANPLVAGEFGLRFYAGVPLKTSDGHSLGTLSVLDFIPRKFRSEEIETLEDLAGMVVSELELRLSGRRASDVSREREILNEAFVGMLSHEIRTPATIIYAASEVLAKDPDLGLNAKARELFADITSESSRLLRLLDDLLVLTRVERDGLELDEEPVLLQRVVPRCVDLERRRAPDRTFAVDVGYDLPPVSGDQGYIEQVMSNLLSNAVKYSPPDRAITVTMFAVEEEVEVRVSDLGMGIPPDDREVVFRLMFREPTAAKHAPGAGIGLYVCRRLLEAMNGRIWVEGTPSGGTEMVFRLMALDA